MSVLKTLEYYILRLIFLFCIVQYCAAGIKLEKLHNFLQD